MLDKIEDEQLLSKNHPIFNHAFLCEYLYQKIKLFTLPNQLD